MLCHGVQKKSKRSGEEGCVGAKSVPYGSDTIDAEQDRVVVLIIP